MDQKPRNAETQTQTRSKCSQTCDAMGLKEVVPRFFPFVVVPILLLLNIVPFQCIHKVMPANIASFRLFLCIDGTSTSYVHIKHSLNLFFVSSSARNVNHMLLFFLFSFHPLTSSNPFNWKSSSYSLTIRRLFSQSFVDHLQVSKQCRLFVLQIYKQICQQI